MNILVYLFLGLLIGVSHEVNLDNDHNLDETDELGRQSDNIEQMPVFLNPKKMLQIYVKPVGNMITLRCKASGNPVPNVTWYKNNNPLTRQLGVPRYKQWALILEDLVTDDSGNYSCAVCNKVGCISNTYTLEVVEKYHNRPILTEYPENKTVIVGSNVNFSCAFISELPPTIHWMAGNTLIQNGTSSPNPETLEIRNISYESEEWYTCVVTNSLGSTSARAYLKVVEDGEVPNPSSSQSI